MYDFVNLYVKFINILSKIFFFVFYSVIVGENSGLAALRNKNVKFEK